MLSRSPVLTVEFAAFLQSILLIFSKEIKKSKPGEDKCVHIHIILVSRVAHLSLVSKQGSISAQARQRVHNEVN